MGLSEELAQMDVEQVRQALSQARLELDDVLEEKEFTLGQTGVHIGAGELARLRSSWARDEERLQERIDALSARLTELGSAP